MSCSDLFPSNELDISVLFCFVVVFILFLCNVIP